DERRGKARLEARSGHGPFAPCPRFPEICASPIAFGALGFGQARPKMIGTGQTMLLDRGPGFGVYIHWPFCAAKCPYCDFNSHVRHAAPDQVRFAAAFAREIGATAARTPGRTVTSIFLGGGTPSLMAPKTVGAILDAVARHWAVAPDAEVT